jgi:transcriptional regulator with XRE-family HTH domain
MVDDIPKNLRLLCSYARSVSEVCRRSGINRQQFNRYLTGESRPSLRTVRRLCDFFGLEDFELFLGHAEFRELIRLRPVRLGGNRDAARQFLDALRPRLDGNIKDAGKYLGFYFTYFQSSRHPGTIYRNLVQIRDHDGALMSKQINRLSGENVGLPRWLRFTGIVYGVGDRIIVTEREPRAGNSIWHTVLFTTDYDRPSHLVGLLLGVTPEVAHQIICYRTIWEYLGPKIHIKESLKRCGRHPIEGAGISAYVLRCTANDAGDEGGFLQPRF